MATAWQQATEYLQNNHAEAPTPAMLDALAREHTIATFAEWWMYESRNRLSASIVPQFLNSLAVGGPTAVPAAVALLHAQAAPLIQGAFLLTQSPGVRKAAVTLEDRLFAQLCAKVVAPGNTFNVQLVFEQYFYASTTGSSLQELGTVCNSLHALRLMPSLEDTFGVVLQQIVDTKLQDMTAQHTFSSLLATCVEWLHSQVWPWLTTVLGGEACADVDTEVAHPWARSRGSMSSDWACEDAVLHDTLTAPEPLLVTWKRRLEYHVHMTLQRIRVSQLFDIIVSYPDSLPALLDIFRCLERTHALRTIATAFLPDLHRRLLHAASSTPQILRFFIVLVKALRVLDPQDVVVESLCNPISEYLRTRSDTVRCIVVELAGDASSDLYQELASGQGSLIDKDDETEALDDDLPLTTAWTPDPVEIDPALSARPRAKDLVSRLVGIYGSKEMFVAEYKALLASRLLEQPVVDVGHEERTIQLLATRFGHSAFADCRIMLKDAKESRTLSADLVGQLLVNTALKDLPAAVFSAVIMSRKFWPASAVKCDVFKPHATIFSLSTHFSQAFTKQRPLQLLDWLTHGVVELDVEVGADTRHFAVSPLQASILMYIGEKDAWSEDDLASVLEIDAALLRKRCALWVQQGVLVIRQDSEGKSVYAAASQLDGAVESKSDEPMEEESTATTDADEEMNVFEQYIVGMLSNLDSLPADRIHNMLKMFVSDEHPYEKSLDELKRFLVRLERVGTLKSADGVYSLVK